MMFDASRSRRAAVFVQSAALLCFTNLSQGDDGQVTFQTTGATNVTLWRVIVAPGAAPENLSEKLAGIGKYPGADTGPITVSPDGQWYVFGSSRFDPDAAGSPVLTIAPDDFMSAETVRTPAGVLYYEGMAQALPGGGAIVFSASGGPHTRDLFLVRKGDAGWSDPMLLTGTSPYAFHSWPVLAVDGSKVVFNASDFDQYGSAGTRIAEVRLDGSGFRVLASPDEGPGYGTSTYCSFPAYSPDGTSVVFEALWGGSEQVWRRSLTGGPPELVNKAYTDDNSPVILPDGRIVSLWLDSPTGNSLHEIKIMNPDGKNPFMLTSTNSPFLEVDDIGVGAGPGWQPSLAATGAAGGAITLSWPARFAGYRLQSATSPVATIWTDLGTVTNQVTMNVAAGDLFFRLKR
jgi:hypothetical protein